jgi:hypothetical protein
MGKSGKIIAKLRLGYSDLANVMNSPEPQMSGGRDGLVPLIKNKMQPLKATYH